jgi:hypothetical protein
MKTRQRVLPCGRVIFFEETTPKDIGTQVTMRKRLLANKKKLNGLVDHSVVGGNNIRWVERVYNHFTTLLTDQLVSHLIQGDRVETFKGHRWMIAARKDAGKYINWHSNGKSYGVVIHGLNGKFGVRLSQRKRKELREKINGGQNYHSV